MTARSDATHYPWMPKIPDHWVLVPFRHVFEESTEVNGPEPVGKMLSVSGYRGVEYKTYETESQVRSNEMLETYRVVRPGQLAVNTMWLNYAGLGVSEIAGHMSPAYRAYSFRRNVNRRFVHYLLRSPAYVDGYTGSLHGVRPNSLQMDRDTLMKWPVILPPIDEQTAIVDYLDRETARIDTLIEKQEKLIAALGNRRHSAAEDLILSGANPLDVSANHRPDFVSLRFGYNVTLGKMLDAGREIRKGDNPLPYIRAANIQDRGLTLDDVKKMPFSIAEELTLDLLRNDLVVVEGGAIGTSFLLKEDMPGWSFQKTVNRVRSHGSWSTSYLGHCLRIYRDSGILDVVCNKSTIPHLTAEKLQSLPIPYKKPEDQERISAILDEEFAKIDVLIGKAGQMISIVKERRAALITAAVTGQIDVRKEAVCG